MSQIVEKCPIWQCKRSFQIPRSGSRCRWLLKFNQFFLVQRYISSKTPLYTKLLTDKQKERKADKCRATRNLLGGGNKIKHSTGCEAQLAQHSYRKHLLWWPISSV